MPLLNRTRPAFTSSSISKRDSFDLPDYYRTTRLEKYGPYYRTSQPTRDLMTSVHLHGRKSDDFDLDLPLPDVFDEEDDANAELEGPRDGNDTEIRHQNKQKRMSWVLRLLSTLRKYCIHNAGHRRPRQDL
ncbi:hypothetical protein L208DRAFT_1391005 [Tricholoma matsutake]|nr:hypothetical protein L208DRAFT_1391005 [Tricholoma matsutake 945]